MSKSNEPTQTWLTQEAADRLKAELAELEGPRRTEIIKKIIPIIISAMLTCFLYNESNYNFNTLATFA